MNNLKKFLKAIIYMLGFCLSTLIVRILLEVMLYFFGFSTEVDMQLLVLGISMFINMFGVFYVVL